MKILAVDTSAQSSSVALCEDEFLLGEFYINIKQTHSETLMAEISALLQLCSVDVSQIELFAVSSGPGSFTGVRIGIACIKGMALPRAIPCCAVSPIEAAAMNFPNYNGIICSVIDARRDHVYNALFEVQKNIVSRLTKDRAIGIDELQIELNSYQKKAIFVGDGAKICYNKIKENCDVEIAPENLRYPRASSVAKIGLRVLSEGNSVSPLDFKPFYLLPTEAERELKKRIEHKSE